MGDEYTTAISPSHNLIGMRMMPQADGSLRLVPTRNDLWQRFSVAALLVGLGGALVGFMLFLEFKMPGPSPEARRQALLALRGIQCLGGMIILGGGLSVLSWFRKRVTLWVDEHGNLVLASRVWVSRLEAFPLSGVQSFQYGVRRVDIGPLINESGFRMKNSVTTVWVWSVTLAVSRGSSKAQPRLERLDVASQSERPRSGERLPEEVMVFCTWLNQATGKPITAMEAQG